MLKAKPFLKWAGGKTQLADTLATLLPAEIATYYEPFVGGAALFYRLAQTGRFQHATLNDVNPELVNCYQVVRDSTDALIAQLGTLQINEDAYYGLRGIDARSLPPVRRAARMIYLNKTCYNGLYRVNRKGHFNVPWGAYEDPKVADEPNLRACAALLNHETTILEGDFVKAVEGARSGDAVYFDPPYVPLTATANFKNYTADGFSLDDQRRVADCFRDLAARGVFVLASNSDTPVVHELYDGFDIRIVQMRRNINSKGGRRGPVNEVVVVSRPKGLTDPLLEGKSTLDDSAERETLTL